MRYYHYEFQPTVKLKADRWKWSAHYPPRSPQSAVRSPQSAVRSPQSAKLWGAFSLCQPPNGINSSFFSSFFAQNIISSAPKTANWSIFLPLLGNFAIHLGEYILRSGEHTPYSGRYASYSGERAPHLGEYNTYSGEYAPHSGECTSCSGEYTPRSGERALYSGEYISRSGKSTPKRSENIPKQYKRRDAKCQNQ